MFDLPHIQSLRTKIINWNLPRPDWFDRLTDENVQKNYNGIGSDKFKLLLAPTTKILSIFEPSACIHDLNWSIFGHHLGMTFEQANSDFRAGCHICASHANPIINIFRPQQRKLYHSIAEDLYKVVNGSVGISCWNSSFINYV